MARWWPLATYVLISLSLLAAVAGLGYLGGRISRAPPVQFLVPTATPPAPITAYVVGEVAEPGVYSLAPASRVIDLVIAAGGLLPSADHAAVNLAARVSDGQRVVVPAARTSVAPDFGATPRSGSQANLTRTPTTALGGPEAAQSASGAGRRAPDGPLNLNTASSAELAALPRIGPATAAAIVEWRDHNGGFRSVDDLLQVRGIGQATLDALRSYVTAP